MGNPRYRDGFAVTLHPDLLELPLRWRAPRRIFVNSMSDLFHDQVPLRFIDQVFDVMARADYHIFQVLTKRPDRLLLWHHSPWGTRPIPAHVWLGVSVESMAYAWRVDRLRDVDATVRFVSAEPLLGPLGTLDLRGISWVIAGGESGGSPDRALVAAKTAEPTTEGLARVRELRDVCRAGRVAFFFKQWGGRTPGAGGRELDGEEWSDYPIVQGGPPPIPVQRADCAAQTASTSPLT
jgi:protein gp37